LRFLIYLLVILSLIGFPRKPKDSGYGDSWHTSRGGHDSQYGDQVEPTATPTPLPEIKDSETDDLFNSEGVNLNEAKAKGSMPTKSGDPIKDMIQEKKPNFKRRDDLIIQR